jgi:hypothetical protein
LDADFQETYGLDFEEYAEIHPKKAVSRVLNLKPTSRIFLKHDPSLAWSVDTNFLRVIAYYAEVLAWQNTKDGQSDNPKNTPKIALAPWEKETIKSPEKKYKTNAEVGDLKEFFKGTFVAVESVDIGQGFVNSNKITNPKEQ